MGKISYKPNIVSGARFLVSYDETRNNDVVLRRALNATQGSEMGTLYTEPDHQATADGDADRVWEYLFKITPQNVAALWATGFSWTQGALTIALGCVMPIVNRTIGYS